MKKTLILLCVVIGVILNGADNPIYPNSIPISCGILKVRLDSAKFWNINGIKYNDLPVSVDLSGAHWGTVFQFPEIGFIGSGHTENESEKVIDIKIFADGKYIPPENVPELIKCSEFKMIKRSRVRDINFKYSLGIRNNQILESCELTADKESSLNLMYNFMHPWSEKMTDYYIQIKNNESQQGEFKTDDKFPYEGKFVWISLYNRNNQSGVVSKFTGGDDVVLFLWDRKQYKKTYLCSFLKKTMSAGHSVNYNFSTAFFESPSEDWIKMAKNIADTL